MRVTRIVEFDAGHRIPHHGSKCRNVHGHRYRLEVTFEGPIREANGAEDGGMVLDFGAIKSVLMSKIHDPWDHAMLVWKNDVALLEAMRVMGDNHKTVVLPCVPTAEHLAQLVFDVLDAEFNRIYGSELRLVFVRLFETPNCWADAVAPNNVKGQ